MQAAHRNKEAIIASIGFFSDISDGCRKDIAEICLPKHVGKKEMLFREGDEGHSVYILASGNVQLYKTGPEGKEIVIKIVKPGEMFAEAILFEKESFPVNALALSSCLLYMLPKHQFLSLLEREEFRKEFFGSIMRKVRYLTNQISYLTVYDVEDRFFLFLQEQYGRAAEMTPRISKKEIAAAIRTTPETLSRLILRLSGEGKLTWENDVIRVSGDVWNRLERFN